MLMTGPVYRKNEEEILKANVQTQQSAAQQKETQSRLSELRPVVRNTEKQLEVKTQMIVLETFKALERGMPKDCGLRTLLG
jgi:Tfp pilus assembly protein PilO